MNEDKILQKLTEHDRRFDLIDKKFSEHDHRFDKLESNFQEFKSRVLTGQDELLTIVRRLDEERVFSANWISRMENEIAGIKEVLKIK